MPKRTSSFVKLLAVVLIPGCIGTVYLADQSTSQSENAKAAAEAAKSPQQKASEAAAKAKAELLFQRAATSLRQVRSGMKDAGSFELSEALTTEAGVFCAVVQGKNSFGAKVPTFVVLTPDDKLTTGPTDAASDRWTRLCAGKRGTDMRHVRFAL